MNNVKATMIDYLQFFTELEFQNQIDIYEAFKWKKKK